MAITDMTLARIAKEAKRYDRLAKRFDAKAEKRKQAIVRELQRRGTKSLTTGGVKMTVVQGSHLEYDLDRLRDSLPTAKLRLITKTVIDKDRLASAVASGKISLAKVNECSDEKFHKAYPVISAAQGD